MVSGGIDVAGERKAIKYIKYKRYGKYRLVDI